MGERDQVRVVSCCGTVYRIVRTPDCIVTVWARKGDDWTLVEGGPVFERIALESLGMTSAKRTRVVEKGNALDSVTLSVAQDEALRVFATPGGDYAPCGRQRKVVERLRELGFIEAGPEGDVITDSGRAWLEDRPLPGMTPLQVWVLKQVRTGQYREGTGDVAATRARNWLFSRGLL